MQEPIRYAPGDPIEAQCDLLSILEETGAKGCKGVYKCSETVLRISVVNRISVSQIFSNPPGHVILDSVATGRWGLVMPAPLSRCSAGMEHHGTDVSPAGPCPHCSGRCQSCSWIASRCRLSDLARSRWLISGKNWWFIDPELMFINKDNKEQPDLVDYVQGLSNWGGILISVPNCSTVDVFQSSNSTAWSHTEKVFSHLWVRCSLFMVNRDALFSYHACALGAELMIPQQRP